MIEIKVIEDWERYDFWTRKQTEEELRTSFDAELLGKVINEKLNKLNYDL